MAFMSDKERLELAKVILLQIMDKPRTLAEVYAYCRAKYPHRKSEIKTARKELGIVSQEVDGVWYWSLPEKEQQP